MGAELDWCVYLVLCADGTLYCGITKQPAARLAAHQAGKGARYTRARGAVAMRVLSSGWSHSQALKEENRIKRLRREQKWALWEAAQPVPRGC